MFVCQGFSLSGSARLLLLALSVGIASSQGFLPPTDPTGLTVDNPPNPGPASYRLQITGKRGEGKVVFGDEKQSETHCSDVLESYRNSGKSLGECEGEKLMGPRSPFQFPVRSEAEVFFSSPQDVRTRGEFAIGRCEDNELLSFTHEPTVNSRKAKERAVKAGEKPLLLVLLSVDGIGGSEFVLELEETRKVLVDLSTEHIVQPLANHRLSSSSFDRADTTAFDRVPRKQLTEALQSHGFMTMANVEGCSASFNTSIPVDNTAYEFYCALELLSTDYCEKELISHSAGRRYIDRFLQRTARVNSFVYSYSVVEDTDIFDSYFADFTQRLFAAYENEREIAIFAEFSRQGKHPFGLVLATQSLLERLEPGLNSLQMHAQTVTTSQDIEQTILHLSTYPSLEESQNGLLGTGLQQSRSCENSAIQPWNCPEYQSAPCGSALLSQLQIRLSAVETPCTPMIIESPQCSIHPATSHTLIEFQAQRHSSFAALFSPAQQLLSIHRMDRLGLLCPALTRETVAPESYCLC